VLFIKGIYLQDLPLGWSFLFDQIAAKDQNFERFAGETLKIIVEVDFDLTGANEIKWVL
jgi:hypothetical protein